MSLDSGVIGLPQQIPAPMGVDSVTTIAPGPIPDLALGTLPADVAPFQAPEFALSRKEFEQTGSPLSGGVPGGGSPQPADALTPALDGAHGVLSGAQGTLGDAQSVLANAQTALDSVPAALVSAQAALARAAANPASILPPLPADPVGDLMKGMALPAIPGLDALFKPFLDLLQSFGTGVLGNFNPTTLLSQGSKFIESAVQVGSGALKTVESLWQGKASQSAQETGKQAENHGQETAQRGFDLSAITNQAAAVVQKGNIQLTAIAQAFATEATAMAPLILTPVGQTTLIASATRHLGEAVAVVNATHGELSVYTAQVQGVIGQLLGQGGGPNPAEVAQSLAQNVGQPILEQAKGLLESGLQAGTPGSGDPSKTNPAGGAPDTMAAGVGGGGGGGGGGAGGGGLGGGGGLPSTPGGPGSSIPGGKMATPANPFGAGAGGIAAMGGPAGSGFMGSPAAAGAGKGGAPDGQHGRTVQPHQSPLQESELTGNLGTFAPGVIGQPEDTQEDTDSDQV
ncbi:hypothetical protein GPX89_11310 [Nocardia sp. ET3-3]|uniref:Uncharacterized protein n=1 Tax=Nocardia terrae TaxID=2675851 RepID=A0A7K1UU11_9NOCA|nr:hypothetical protein [Nocardia terrae]MVU77830.1 hypothetical protein [Nocardia terrae]